MAVPGSSAATTWTVYNGPQAIGTAYGSLPAGPFTVGPGQALTLTGRPPASTSQVAAIMQGEQGYPEEFTPLTPSSPGASSVVPPFVFLGLLSATPSVAVTL